ncbi:Protein of uncharacterised function (DUF2622) [Shigella sonnei]|nr:Protein of uncharacterised function (DUF2622) [Shigella sonnei]SVG85012.1 Protein of uncharacterised function (DUF2622) [Shigella sonnei]
MTIRKKFTLTFPANKNIPPALGESPPTCRQRVSPTLLKSFLLTMTDDEGNIHELGTNTFGLISTQSEEEIRELVSGLTQSATGKDPEITITTWEEWNSNRK